MTKDYYENSSRRDKDFIQCKSLHYLPQTIIFECGTGNGFTFAVNGANVPVNDPCQVCIPKAVGTVCIDTSRLCKPKIKIEFSSIVHSVALGQNSISQLEFILFRFCNNDQESSLGSWLYEMTDSENNKAQTFSFFYCDSNSCPGCYSYLVRVAPIHIEDCRVSVTNCHIAAFAQSACKQ